MKNKQNSPPQFSSYISDFCTMVTDVLRDYEWNKEEVNRLDKLTQDYLHMLELDGLDYKGRAKVASETLLEKPEKSKNGWKTEHTGIRF